MKCSRIMFLSESSRATPLWGHGSHLGTSNEKSMVLAAVVEVRHEEMAEKNMIRRLTILSSTCFLMSRNSPILFDGWSPTPLTSPAARQGAPTMRFSSEAVLSYSVSVILSLLPLMA